MNLINLSVIFFRQWTLLQKYPDLIINKQALSIKASINSPGPVEILTDSTALFIFLSALSVFINGAKVNLRYNIFGKLTGEIREGIRILQDNR